MRRRKTVFVDADILVVGGGMGGCGATYESRYWGRQIVPPHKCEPSVLVASITP
jgi:succinate dehydrogenase/fumarate reductase flavoprotein subunit